MSIETGVGIVAIAFSMLVIFLFVTLNRLLRVIKKTDRVLTEASHLLRSISEPTVDLIENTNKLIVDVKKKSEGLDILFHPLYGLKKEKPERSKSSERLYEILGCALEGIQLFNKIKKEMK
jgi:uncharacterized protein YoxC